MKLNEPARPPWSSRTPLPEAALPASVALRVKRALRPSPNEVSANVNATLTLPRVPSIRVECRKPDVGPVFFHLTLSLAVVVEKLAIVAACDGAVIASAAAEMTPRAKSLEKPC